MCPIYFEYRTVRTCHTLVVEHKRKGGILSFFYLSNLFDGTIVFDMGRPPRVLFVGVE